MKVSYYPGCTLKTKAKNLDETVTGSLKALEARVEELPRWNCCGAVLSLADDDLLHLIAPLRVLIRVQEAGNQIAVTACSMCYNTLARVNQIIHNDEEKLNTLNLFMEEEPDYEGNVEVMHILNFLKDKVGFDTLAEQIQVPLAGLNVAPYYGCSLLRPKDIAIDTRDRPRIFEEFLEALGATAVRFDAAHDCCGSYQVISNPDLAVENSAKILADAARRKADVIASSCPLCEFNIGKMQTTIQGERPKVTGIPTFYFTQLLAVALGLSPEVCHFELNIGGAKELLEERNLLKTMRCK